MPFGPWKNWNACLSEMDQKYSGESAKKVCGKLKSNLEKATCEIDKGPFATGVRLQARAEKPRVPSGAPHPRDYSTHEKTVGGSITSDSAWVKPAKEPQLKPNMIRTKPERHEVSAQHTHAQAEPSTQTHHDPNAAMNRATSFFDKCNDLRANIEKARSILGGTVSNTGDSFLYTEYTPSQRRKFNEAREAERQRQYPNNEDREARAAGVPGKVDKGDLKEGYKEDYPAWQTAQMYKGCPICEGAKHEREHEHTLESVGVPESRVKEAEKKIAEDHIEEDPKYYDKLKQVEKDQFSRNNIIHNFKMKVKRAFDPPPKPPKEEWSRVRKADAEQVDTSGTDEKEIKNLHLRSKLSPGLVDLKEVRELTKDADMEKEWNLDLKAMLASDRTFTGTFHKPVIDKENDIIPAKAMDSAMDDFMVLPMLQEVHTERPVGIIVKAWKTGDDEYKFIGKIKPGEDCNDVWDKVQKGIYDGLSIGGRRIKYSAQCSIPSSIRTTPCVTHKLKLYNVSVCSSPVNPEATVDTVAKSEDCIFDLTEMLIKAE